MVKPLDMMTAMPPLKVEGGLAAALAGLDDRQVASLNTMSVRRFPEPCAIGSPEVDGHESAVLPQLVVEAALKHSVLRDLLPIAAGFRPKAAGHRAQATGLNHAILTYCIQGHGWCSLEGSRHVVNPGHLLVLPPGMPHVFGAGESEPWTVSWVQVLGTNLDFYLKQLGTTPRSPVIFVGHDKQFLALMYELIGVLGNGHTLPRLLYAAQTLAHLLAAMIWHRADHELNQPDANQRIEQCMDYMHRHLNRALHVGTLATLANMSPSRFTVLFKGRTGYTPIDYFIRLRMQQARHLLEATLMSVKAIAAALGYEDPFYFSRAFKSVHQISPREYRRLCGPH